MHWTPGRVTFLLRCKNFDANGIDLQSCSRWTGRTLGASSVALLPNVVYRILELSVYNERNGMNRDVVKVDKTRDWTLAC
jgi:hypothetical protein